MLLLKMVPMNCTLSLTVTDGPGTTHQVLQPPASVGDETTVFALAVSEPAILKTCAPVPVRVMVPLLMSASPVIQ